MENKDIKSNGSSENNESKKPENKDTKSNESRVIHYKKYIDIFMKFSLAGLIFMLLLPNIPFFHLEELKTPAYTISISVITGLNAFYVLPILVEYLHKKELRLQHLLSKKYRSRAVSIPINEKTYIKVYRYLICSASSILLGILIYYLEYDLHDTKLNWIEIGSVFLAYIACFRKVQQLISQGLIFVLHRCKNRCKPITPSNSDSNLEKKKEKEDDDDFFDII